MTKRVLWCIIIIISLEGGVDMSELEKYVVKDKKARVVAFLEQIRDELLELINKRYTNDDIIKMLNRALKDNSFRQKYKVEISQVRGDVVRKYLNSLRREMKRDGKSDKRVAKAREKSDTTKTSPSTSNIDARSFMPSGIDDEL